MAEPEGPAHRVEVRVELKPEVADAEAESVARSLGQLGIDSVRAVHIARLFELEFVGVSEEEAERRARDAVERLLANPVIHRVAIRPLAGGAR